MESNIGECQAQLEEANNKIKRLQVQIENSKKIQNTINERTNRFIDESLDPWLSNVIRFSFVVLTFIGVCFALINFTIDGLKLCEGMDVDAIEENGYLEKFNESIVDKDTTILETLSRDQELALHEVLIALAKKYPKIEQNKRDINLLKFIEHIFIYLIPILVFLGLYYYYSINYSDFLRNKGSKNDTIVQKNRMKKAKDALHLTKSLFISSILAYTIIKIVEKVILAENDKIPNVELLVSYGIFILLLIAYLIFSHIGEYKKSDDH